MLAGKGLNRAEEGMIRAGYGSERSLIKKENCNSPSFFN